MDIKYGSYEKPPRKMYKIVCADCGREAEVPFKPDGVRPVYCKECYRKRKFGRF